MQKNHVSIRRLTGAWSLILTLVLILIQLSCGLVHAEEGSAHSSGQASWEGSGNQTAVMTRADQAMSPKEIAFNGSYLKAHCNSKFVGDVDPKACQSPVAYARSNAAYTVKGGNSLKEGKGHRNVIAGMHYYTLIYDINPESQYYAALPDVNMGKGDFSPYAVDVVYNNNSNETLKDVFFDKSTSILYIHKKYYRSPASKEPLFDDAAPVAIQVSYQMPADRWKDNAPDFSKQVPVLVFTDEEGDKAYRFRQLEVNNMFDVTTLLPTQVKDPSAYSKESFVISLNGTFAPLSEEEYSYNADTGEITLEISAATISSITIMVKKTNLIASLGARMKNLKDSMSVFAADTISHGSMSALKNTKGKYIFIADENGDLFDKIYLGWRGSYKSKDVSGSSMKYNVHTDELIDACGGDSSFFKHSVKYLYAASSKSAAWAILSYAIGNDATKTPSKPGSVGIDPDKKIEVPEKDGKGDPLSRYGGKEGKNTLYDWMDIYRTHLLSYEDTKKEDAAGSHYQTQFVNSEGQRNGAITFAFQFPEHITGEPSLVDSEANQANQNGGVDSRKKLSLDIVTDEINQDNKNLWLAGWCRHMDDGNTKEDGDTVYVSCIGKGKDSNGKYVILSWSSAGAYSKYEQTGGAVYKVYVEESCGKCGISKTTEKVYDPSAAPVSEEGATFQVWNTKYETYDKAAKEGTHYAQTLVQKNGSAVSGDLVKGKYKLLQINAGKLAAVSRLSKLVEFEIQPGKTVWITPKGAAENQDAPFVNRHYTVDLILKKRSDDRVIEHFENDSLASDAVIFSVDSVEDAGNATAEGFHQTVSTDHEGVAVIKGLQAGRYKITEEKTAPGYYLPEEHAVADIIVGIKGDLFRVEDIDDDDYAFTEISDQSPSSDENKVYQITWMKNNTPQNTTLHLTKNRLFRNEAGELEQKPQPEVEFNLYAKGDIKSYDGHEDHVYYKDGTLIQGIHIDTETGKRTFYVDGKETNSEEYRIITGPKGEWHSTDTPWKYYPLTGEGASYVMKETCVWEMGDHISFTEEEKDYLTKIWTESLHRLAEEQLQGAGEMSFSQVLNHGIDLHYSQVTNEEGNTDRKTRYSSNGFLIDDVTLKKFVINRIATFIKKDESTIINENNASVGTIERDVRIISPVEPSDISKVQDVFQCFPFDSASLTTEHMSAFVNDQIPVVATKAGSGKKNLIKERGKSVITDSVAYENLIPGTTYTIEGTLYDKGTGQVLKRNGTSYVEMKNFTPVRRKGTMKLQFNVSAREVKGDVVVFEKLTANGATVTIHENPDNASQTVRKQGKHKKTSIVKNRGHKMAPQTGDERDPLLWWITGGAFVLLLLFLAIMKRKGRLL